MSDQPGPRDRGQVTGTEAVVFYLLHWLALPLHSQEGEGWVTVGPWEMAVGGVKELATRESHCV